MRFRSNRRSAMCIRTAAAAISFGGLAGVKVAMGSTFTWAGPFGGSGTSNPWSNASSWVGLSSPVSSPVTSLVFPNYDFDGYTAENDLSASFQVNDIIVPSWSTNPVTIASYNKGTGATGQIQFSGTNPGFTDAGPGQAVIGTLVSGSGYGLFLNGSAGSPTTFNGSGNGLVNIGSSTAGINGSGGLVFAGTGLGYFNLLGGNSAAPNDFTGGVTVDSGTLEISSSLALASNTLTIDGGSVQSLTTLSLPNPVVANTTVTVNVGTFNLSGGISGPGGLHLLDGSGNGAADVIISAPSSYTGATSIDNAPLRINTTALSTLTIGPAGALTGTSSVTIGQGGTLSFTAGATNSALPSAAPITSNGGLITVLGSAATTNETLGSLSTAGLTTITYANVSAGSNPTNTLSFGTFNSSDQSTLFFRGAFTGSANTTTSIAAVKFAGGLATAPDPNAAAGVPPVVPFAYGNLASTTTSIPGAFVTYNASGVGLISTGDPNLVVQLSNPVAANGSGGGPGGGAGGSFAALPVGDRYVNINGLNGSYPIPSGQTSVYALSTSTTSSTTTTSLTGNGTLTVVSGAVVLGSGLKVNGPTLDFGTATGYLHVPYTNGQAGLDLQAGSITGSGGLVVSGELGGGTAANIQFEPGDTANSFTGGLTVNGGVFLQFTADAQLGASGQTVTLNGGELYFNLPGGSGPVSHPIRLGSAGGGIIAYGGDDLAVASNISGPGGLYFNAGFAGTGTVTLTGTNSYLGPTYLATGTLNVSSDANLGAVTSPLVLAGGVLQFGSSGTFNKPISGGGTFDTNGNSPTLAGNLSGVVANLTKIGSGSLTLVGANPQFAGTINVAAGTVAVSGPNGAVPQIQNVNVGSGAVFQLDDSVYNSPNRFPDAGRVTFSGGTFALVGNTGAASSETIGGLNLAGVAGVPTSYISADPASATLTVSGFAAGDGLYTSNTNSPTSLIAAPQPLTKIGRGTVVLSNANTFTGGVIVSAGTLRLTNPGALGFGAVTTGFVGTSSVSAGASLDLAGQTITEPITLNGGTLTNSAATPAVLTSGVKGYTINIDTPATNYAANNSSFTIGTAGSGYAPTDTVTATGGTGASATVILGLTNNSFTVTNPGNYYYATATPTVTITGGGGTGATAVVSENDDGTLGPITITNPGSGYTSAPTVTLSNPPTSGGTDTPAVVTGNATGFGIVGVQETAAGSGFNSSATAVINTATGSGASINSPYVSSINLASTSSVGGTGNLNISAQIFGAGGLVKTGAGTVTLFTAETYTGDTAINGGTLLLTPAASVASANFNINSGGTLTFGANNVSSILIRQVAASLNVNTGGTLTLAAPASHSSRQVLVASSLNIAGSTTAWTGLVDLSANDMIVQNGNLAQVTSQVMQGYNGTGGGNWQGSGGITSTAAASDTKHLTALGVIINDANGTPIYGSGTAGGLFDGTSPGPGDVLVKYTYFGDANLDGKVDGSDYALIDAGYAADKAHPASATGWYNGDFNYDGTVDGSDYALIDNAFNNQGPQLTTPQALIATGTDQVAGVAAVPEPATVGIGWLALSPLVRRRRGR